MIDKKFTARLLRSILRRSQGLSDHYLIHPEREWFAGIGIAILALGASSAWSFNLYTTHAEATPHTTEANITTNQVYREAEIKGALEEITKLREENAQIRQSLENQSATPLFIPISTETTPEEPQSESTEFFETNTPTTIESSPTSTIPQQAL